MRRFGKKRSVFILGIIIFFLIGFLFSSVPLRMNRNTVNEQERVMAVPVVSIIDGDTIIVSIDGKEESVRLIGIDSPEYGKDDSEGECFHEEATSRMKDLVGDKSVRLQSDPEGDDRDTYGRLLRFIFLPDGTNVGEIMVREGFAREYTYLGNKYLYYEKFKEAEKLAKSERLGLWSDVCK